MKSIKINLLLYATKFDNGKNVYTVKRHLIVQVEERFAIQGFSGKVKLLLP